MKVLCSRAFLGWEHERLSDTEVARTTIATDLDRRRPEVGALATLSERVDETLLDQLPNLLIVANYGVGYDMIDVDACTRHGVAVTNTPGVVDAATADLAIALMLTSRRGIHVADRLVRAMQWRSLADDLVLGHEVHDSTLGIVGCGRIGRAVARRARAFDMRILYTQRTRLPVKTERKLRVEYRSLDDLLCSSDVVTLHCPLTEETRGLLGANELGLLREGALLINTARAAIVEQDALVTALETGKVSACLDVYEHEPDVPAALLSLDNVVLSPHLGTATVGTRVAMTRLMIDNIVAAFGGEPLITPVLGSSARRSPPMRG